MARVEEGLQLLLLNRCLVFLIFLFFALDYIPLMYILIFEGHLLKIITIP
jgi:hypothetical protein